MVPMSARLSWIIGGTIASVLASAAPSHAQLTQAYTFKNLTHEQTAPTTVIDTGAFFNAGGLIAAAGQFDSASLTYPGAGSPQNLPFTSPTQFGIGVGFATQAAMDAAYPFGTYSITVLNTSTSASQTATLSYTADAYTADVPALSAASFNLLQGLPRGPDPVPLTFNTFTPSPLATSAFTFFTIFGTSDGCSFLSPSADFCTIYPNTLTPDTTYTWELDFSDRIEATVDGVLTGVNFDVRTDGVFTTAAAVPEPVSLALFGSGLVALVCMRRRPNT